METTATPIAHASEAAEQRMEMRTAAKGPIISHEVASEGRARKDAQRQSARPTRPHALNALITDRAHYRSPWGQRSLARFVWIKWLGVILWFCS